MSAIGFYISYNWEIPGIPSLGFVGKRILGGWESNGILTLANGQPFSAWSGIDDSLSGIGLDRADVVGNPNLGGGRSRSQQVAEWFNTSAFKANALGTYGSVGRDTLLSPGLENFDFSMIKNIPLPVGPLKETQRLQFRAEFFNLFNRTNFNIYRAGAHDVRAV